MLCWLQKQWEKVDYLAHVILSQHSKNLNKYVKNFFFKQIGIYCSFKHRLGSLPWWKPSCVHVSSEPLFSWCEVSKYVSTQPVTHLRISVAAFIVDGHRYQTTITVDGGAWASLGLGLFFNILTDFLPHDGEDLAQLGYNGVFRPDDNWIEPIGVQTSQTSVPDLLLCRVCAGKRSSAHVASTTLKSLCKFKLAPPNVFKNPSSCSTAWRPYANLCGPLAQQHVGFSNDSHRQLEDWWTG